MVPAGGIYQRDGGYNSEQGLVIWFFIFFGVAGGECSPGLLFDVFGNII